MTKRVNTKKWILRRHTSDLDILITTAIYLKGFSKSSFESEDRKLLLLKLKELGRYNERNKDIPIDKVDHLIKTLCFYMFGYITKVANQKTFLFSPLGNLFLKNSNDEEKRSKIFFTMLWGMQFPHPESGTEDCFQLYPFRLIFKLLHDPRLHGTLYAFEVACSVVFTRDATKESYEALVENILNLRNLSNAEIEEIAMEDSHAFVNATYEWDYYTTKVLEAAGLIEKTEGAEICRLFHGEGKTSRKLTRNKISFSPKLEALYQSLENNYPFDARPVPLNDDGRLKIDAVKEIFNFYPRELLIEIGEISVESEKELELLELPRLIELYANNNEGEQAYLFEEKLTDGFNIFYNVQANWIGGAGNTDIECLYTSAIGSKKFAVDAKSTKNKLTSLSSGRLAAHREKIGAKYTIVVTPRYVPAVKSDIYKTANVILLANTFTEYLYNCINNDIRMIDFTPFDKIVEENLGQDISSQISRLTLEKFGLATEQEVVS
jgi:hypothetical protein